MPIGLRLCEDFGKNSLIPVAEQFFIRSPDHFSGLLLSRFSVSSLV